MIVLNWISSYYDYSDPANPIKYRMNADNDINYDYRGLGDYIFNFERKILHTIDGAERVFWDVKQANFFYKDKDNEFQFFVMSFLILMDIRSILSTINIQPLR